MGHRLKKVGHPLILIFSALRGSSGAVLEHFEPFVTAPGVEVVTAANVEPSEGAFGVLNLSECVFMLHVCLKCYDDHLGCPVP